MVHLIVGNTGSGKTTYAQNLKAKTNAIVFSIDKWNNTLFLPDKKATDGLDWFLERIERSEIMILDLIHQLEQAGIDSILDLGLAKFEHREKFRVFCTEHNYQITTHFLDIPKAIRLERVLKRNTEKGNTFEFEVSKTDFDFMETWFEIPTAIELKDSIIIHE